MQRVRAGAGASSSVAAAAQDELRAFPRDPQAKTSRRGFLARELDELIAEITVDAYGEDEAWRGEFALPDLESRTFAVQDL
jgi:hypothetical protein